MTLIMINDDGTVEDYCDARDSKYQVIKLVAAILNRKADGDGNEYDDLIEKIQRRFVVDHGPAEKGDYYE